MLVILSYDVSAAQMRLSGRVVGGEINSSTSFDDSRDRQPVGDALIYDITIPASSIFEADISVQNHPGQTDREDIGFIWRFFDPLSNATTFNTISR